MVVLSMLLAGTIAGPVRRLAEGAERVRRRIRSRVEIPDFTSRRDEIGHLSGALRDMTNALYSRIEAIESFAADVAHELKNPLTSLRSAVETLPLAKTAGQPRAAAWRSSSTTCSRLDRLISDISDASRLDAELQRGEPAPVDLARLLNTVVAVAERSRSTTTAPRYRSRSRAAGRRRFVVPGHDSRLGQVVNNLIDNARSFSPPDGTVRVIGRAPARRGRDRRRRRRAGHPAGRVRARSSSASTPTGRIRASARTPGSACRSPSRSSRRMAAGSGPRTASAPRRADGEPPVLGARFMVRLPAVVTVHGDDVDTIHASAVLVGARAVLIRGAVRLRQVAAGAGAAACGADAARCRSRGWSATTASMSSASHGRLLVRPAPALAGLIEVRGARHPAGAVRAAGGGRAGGRSRRGRRRAAARACRPAGRNRGNRAAAAAGRSGRRSPAPVLAWFSTVAAHLMTLQEWQTPENAPYQGGSRHRSEVAG